MSSAATPSLHLFLIFLRLGLTSFGGPVAHLGYFHHEFVARRRWLSEFEYADLVALCQCLPGPASSQFGIALGFRQGGYLGALAAWLGFTLPSALLMAGAAWGIQYYGLLPNGFLMSGLKLAAVAVVAHAVWNMGWQLCRTRGTRLLAVMALAGSLMIADARMQLLFIIFGAVVGRFCLSPAAVGLRESISHSIPNTASSMAVHSRGISPRQGIVLLLLFAALLVLLPALMLLVTSPALSLSSAMYRAGALVFGGGHVVLPLLEAEFVQPVGSMSADHFLAGYALAQVVPGPLFTFAAYLGMSEQGVTGALLATLMIFLPAFLLVLGALPFWQAFCAQPRYRAVLTGINAVVVGILAAALYHPVASSAIHRPSEALIAVVGWLALQKLRWSPIRVIGLTLLLYGLSVALL